MLWDGFTLFYLVTQAPPLYRTPDLASPGAYLLATALVWAILLSPGLLMVPWSLFSNGRAKKRHVVEHAAWAERQEQWKRSYYCTKDDLLFTPAEGGFLVYEDE